jgi:sensor histidine kinase YesM
MLLWVGYFVFEVFAYVNYDYTFNELTYLFFLAFPAKAIFIYSTIFWSIPKFFFEKKYFAFGLIAFLVLLLSTVMHRNALYFGFLQYYRPEVFNSIPLWDLKSLFRSFEFILTISSVFIAFSMVRLSYAQHKMNNQLLTANISAELKSLKEQIKPHFLFNTLNNLYGLTKKDPWTSWSTTPGSSIRSRSWK